MKTEWFKHLKTKEERESFKEYVANSKDLLDRLQNLCYTYIQDAEKSSPTDYDSPAWAYRQADKVGYIRALKQIIELTKIERTMTDG